ncbi:MAG: hypothetical protein AB1454_04015 [Candidatus Auribacterota bacterium]
MVQKTLKIKAKDCASLTLGSFSELPIHSRTELVAHHFCFKRRRLNKDVLDAYLQHVTPELIRDVLTLCSDTETQKKFFRAMKNIRPETLNAFLKNNTKKNVFETINLLKLEDRRKISPDILLQLKPAQLSEYINDHFSSFGKLPNRFFSATIKSLDPEAIVTIFQSISSEHIGAFCKAVCKNDCAVFSKLFGFNKIQGLLEGIKGSIGLSVVEKGDFLIRCDKINKRNVILVHASLFQNSALLGLELELQLYFIKLKQRKHIDVAIEPLFHDIKLLHFLLNMPSKLLKSTEQFIKKHVEYDSGYLYRYIAENDFRALCKVTANQYNKIMQGIFDLFYDQFADEYAKGQKDDPVFKKNVRKQLACRLIEYHLEDSDEIEIPFLLQFDSYLDADGRTLLGYYRNNGLNIEIRPTIKQFSNSFVRFRPRFSGMYDVFKINSKGKVLDFVPVNYILADSKFQHLSPGYAVACYLKGKPVKPLTFRTYLTSDSKLYFGKIDNEVIQTLISYLEGTTPVECLVKRNEDYYSLQIYLLNTHSGKYEFNTPVRVIDLQTEKPYFKNITHDFNPSYFLEMDKNAFNNTLQYFKKDYFITFYDTLTIDQKKQIFEKLTQQGEDAFIDRLGEERFNEELEKLSFTFGDDLDLIDDFMGDRGGMESAEYIEIADGRRKSDFHVQDVPDLDDDSYFAMRESARLDEFGFDFISYPPELTFKIKMEILAKIYESFPQDLRRYIKIHAAEIDDEMQEKINSIDPRLLDGVPLEKAYAVRRNPVKRAFINDLIKFLEDKISYDTINEMIVYLRDSSIRIYHNDVSSQFIVRSAVVDTIAAISGLEPRILISSLSLHISDS